MLDFARFMPPTLITRSLGVAREFLAKHGAMVVKPLHGNAGKAVFKIEPRRRQPRAPDRAVQHAPIANRTCSRRSFPRWPRATSASSWSTARSPARSTAFPARAKSAPTSPPAGAPRSTELTRARAGNLRRARPRAQAPRAAVRRHRRDRRRMADRDQRHLADRDRRHRPVQRHRHAGADLGRDRAQARASLAPR